MEFCDSERLWTWIREPGGERGGSKVVVKVDEHLNEHGENMWIQWDCGTGHLRELPLKMGFNIDLIGIQCFFFLKRYGPFAGISSENG